MSKNLKLRIKNLGIVKNATIELSDLIFFIGKNNTNKTWTAYVLHAVASDSMLRKYIYRNLWFRKGRPCSAWEKIINHYLGKIESYLREIDAPQSSELSIFTSSDASFIKDLLKHYLGFVTKHIHEFISIDKNLVKDLKISVLFPKEREFERELIARINQYVNRSLRTLLLGEEGDEEIKKKRFYTYDLWIYVILNSIMRALFGRPFNLPVERNTLVTFATLISLGEGKFVNISNLLSTFKELHSSITTYGTQEKPKLELTDQFTKFSEQLISFIDSVMSAQYYNYNYPVPIKLFKEFVQRLTSLSPADKELNSKLLNILKEVIGGEITVDKRGIFYKTKEVTLPIFVSSSMVKSLAGLYAYLGYRAEKGDLLIIDEPESNLHPEAQVKMVEFLACMANNGIRVLTTTHSPYVVDHLTNLLEAKRSQKKAKDIREKFFLKTEEAFIDRNRVSAYFFTESGEVKDVLDKKSGMIDWETFSSISDRINQIYYEI